MYSLFIDTHDKNVVVIIYKDGKVFKMKNVESKNKHSEITMPIIDSLFGEAKLDVKDLNEVIVVNGPGSFTGERIAVTIGKTIAYCLSIPIKAIDSLSIIAVNVDKDTKYVSLPDRNGAFVGVFDKDNKRLEDFVYLNKSSYADYIVKHDVVYDIDIDYDKVYELTKNIDSLNPHEVKPLYVKGISALNDK
ncbi:MAG: tRNA (adenosine(37)-N6)-threonylcarbamoyltransferase complex dimerization subunit type 1 TsaB [Bacilli bacterium]|nr:tRNA (adenosine(37)-N6)-threonylcarbamoyltransferase complex dimerization subunit type 1 TsaB [Bacilli bacterium]